MSVICPHCQSENEIEADKCSNCNNLLDLEKKSKYLDSGKILDKRYEIARIIKKGGMGTVYEAKDNRLEEICAIKELVIVYTSPEKKADAIRRFYEELKILTKLRHGHLPRIRDYFIEDERYYLVMDCIEGQDMETIWNSTYGKKLQEKQVVEWTLQILQVLDYLHSQTPPVIYRDIKPSNIMLKKDTNEIILVDFGIAKTVSQKSQRVTSSGTKGYSPPEQYKGVYLPQSDVYSLGVTMHQLLSGEEPVAFNFSSIREKNPLVSKDIDDIVMKALKEKPYERFSSALEMSQAIIDVYKSSDDQHLQSIGIKYELEKKLKTAEGIIDILTWESEMKISPNKPIEQIDLFLMHLDSPNPELRKLAVETLGRYKDGRAVKGIIKSLGDSNIEVVIKSIALLGNNGITEAVPYLIDMLSNETEEIRVYSAEALGKIMNSKSVKPLIKALEDKSPLVRKYASISLGFLGDSEALKPLIEARNRENIFSLHMREVMGEAIDRLSKGPTGEQYLQIAHIYMCQGKLELAEKYYRKALDMKVKYGEIYVNLANIYVNQGKYEKAMKEYENAKKIIKNNPELHNAIGNTCFNMGNIEMAIEEYKRAIELNPDWATSYNNLGYAYHIQGEYYNAILEYRKALELEPDFAMAHNNLGNAYGALGNYELAVEEYKKSIKAQAGISLIHNNLGFAFARLDKHDLAVQSYQEAINLNPNSPMAQGNIAFSYGIMKKYDLAIKHYEKAIELSPQNSMFYNGLAQVYQDCENYNMAIKTYEKSLEISDSGKIHEKLANIYMEIGDIEKAIHEFQEAIRLEPTKIDLYNNLGCIYTEMEEYDKAINEYKKALVINPNDATLYSNLGYTCIFIKDYNMAIKQYLKAISLEPKNPNLYYNLACIYIEQQEFLQAIKELKKALSFTEDPDLIEEINKIMDKIQIN